jgi:hypothetical protein
LYDFKSDEEIFMICSRAVHLDRLPSLAPFRALKENSMNRFYDSVVALVLGFVGLVGCDYEPHATEETKPANVAEMSQAIRDLWVGQILWVRHVVSNKAANKQERWDAAEKEVVANAKQIAQAVTPFYGEAASQKFLSLLDINYGAVKAYSEAAVSDNARWQHAALARLESNADEIATFLSHLHPCLQKDIIRGLIAAHSAHRVPQINQYKVKEYAPLEDTGT